MVQKCLVKPEVLATFAPRAVARDVVLEDVREAGDDHAADATADVIEVTCMRPHGFLLPLDFFNFSYGSCVMLHSFC